MWEREWEKDSDEEGRRVGVHNPCPLWMFLFFLRSIFILFFYNNNPGELNIPDISNKYFYFIFYVRSALLFYYFSQSIYLEKGEQKMDRFYGVVGTREGVLANGFGGLVQFRILDQIVRFRLRPAPGWIKYAYLYAVRQIYIFFNLLHKICSIVIFPIYSIIYLVLFIGHCRICFPSVSCQ